MTILVLAIISYGVRTIARNEDWNNPARFWRRTIMVSPYSGRAHNSLGLVYAKEGNIQRAIEEYKRAIQINPGYKRAYNNLANLYNNLGIAYNALGDRQNAIISLKKALSINPKYAKAYNNLAVAYNEAGDREEAIVLWEEALKIVPRYAQVYFNLSETRQVLTLKLGSSNELKIEYIPIVEVKPGDYVLSLNEQTGQIEPHRINGLLDMGVKPVFRLTTADGRTIRTTGNHPYLAKGDLTEEQRKEIAHQRIKELAGRRTFQAEDFSEEYEFSQPKSLRLLSEENRKEKGLMTDFSFQGSDALVHINSQTELFLERTDIISEIGNFLINILDFFIQPAQSNIDFFIQPFNLNLQRAQLRSNNVLESFFNTFINICWHANPLVHLKHTIVNFIYQVKNSNLREGEWEERLYPHPRRAEKD